MIMEKFLYLIHSVRCIITGPSNLGKSVFLTILHLKFINEYDRIYIYSRSLHQDFYRKLTKCFNIYIPFHIIPTILNEEDIDEVMDNKNNINDFEKLNTEIETFNSFEELSYPQD